MTFLENVECVTISLNNRTLSTVERSRHKGQEINIPDHMERKSPEHNMTINSVEVIREYRSVSNHNRPDSLGSLQG